MYSQNFPIYLILILFSLPLEGQSITEKAEQLLKASDQAYVEGDYPKSIAFAEQAVEFLKENEITKDTLYIASILKQGQYNQLVGNYKIAEKLYKEADALIGTVSDRNLAWEAQVANAFGLLYDRTGKAEKALNYYKSALDKIIEFYGQKHLAVAAAYNNLSSAYRKVGRIEEAGQFLEQGLQICVEIKGENDPQTGALLNNLASFYRGQGKLEKSKALYIRAERNVEKNFGKQHSKYGRVMNNSALVYMQLNELDIAEKRFKVALKVRKAALGPTHYRVATVLGNMGGLKMRQKSYAEAEKLYQQAIEINKIALGNKHQRVAAAQLKLLGALWNQKKYEDAMALVYDVLESNAVETIDKTKPIKELLLDHEFVNIFIARTAVSYRASYLQKRYKKEGNLKDLQASFELYESIITFLEKEQLKLASQKDKLRVLRSVPAIAEKAMNIGFELYGKEKEESIAKRLIELAEANKSAVLSAAINANAALKFGELPDSLVAQQQGLKEKRAELKSELIKAQNQSDSSKMNVLKASVVEVGIEQDKLSSLIKGNYPKYNQLMKEHPQLDFEQLQEKLKEKDAVILEYFVYDTSVYLMAVDAEAVAVKKLSFTKGALDKNIADLRKALSDYRFIAAEKDKAYQLYTSSAFYFYDKLINPLSEMIKQHKMLIIIPDGELGHLPYEAFLTQKVEEEKAYAELPYLLEQKRLSYSYSIQLLEENLAQKSSSAQRVFLGIAASYGKAGTEKAMERSGRAAELRSLRDALEDLPAARKEVAQLEESFEGEFLFDEEAIEANFKEKAVEASVIHLAMHGLLNEKYPVLSSLAFTENGDSTEDNFLQAYEISNMQLHADLVVLSACETGYGKFQQGEGVMSLARSFMYAGVPSLVVSLWQVNDASTAIIMQNFYANLAKGQNKAEALQQAKLDYITKASKTNPFAAHPAFWAAFIQLGDSRPVQIAQKGGLNWTYLLWGLGLLVLVGGGIWAWRAKKAIA